MKSMRFLGWSGPLPDLVAPQLLNTGYRYADTSSVDLSRFLVLIPSRSAASVLTRKMTELLRPLSGGIFPPEFYTPERFLLEGAPSRGVASAAEQLRAWKEVLLTCDRQEFHRLFPVDFPNDSESMILNLSRQFHLLKRELSAGGHRMDSVRDSGISSDTERWEQIAGLESRYTQLLSGYGLRDPEDMKISLSGSVSEFQRFEKILVIGVPDLSTIMIRRLELASESCDVEVWVNAPYELESMFDAWGRSLPERWANYPLSFGSASPDPNEEDITKRIFKTDTVEQMASLAAALLTGEGGPDLKGKQIAVSDESFFDPFRKEFSKIRILNTKGRSLIVTSPSGEPMKKLRLYDLLSRFGLFLSDDEFDLFFELFRHQDVLGKTASALSLREEMILTQLDTFRMEHIPETLSGALEISKNEVRKILNFAIDRKKEWLSLPPAEAVRKFLSFLFDGRDTQVSSGIPLRNELDEVEKQLKIIERSPLFSADSLDTILPELLECCSSIRLYREPMEHEFSIGGFLELPWSDSSDIILCGMNDGFIPESVHGSTFLSDTVRTKLELSCNQRRYGRDVLYLESLLQTRGAEHIRLIASRCDAAGKPLKFSRLFFQGSDRDVFDRASILFEPVRFPEKRMVDAERDNRGFLLKPDYGKAGTEEILLVSVTQFREYLKSPFRFFLANFLKMREQNYDLQELDRGAFGTCCHKALERAGRSGSSHPDEIEKDLFDALDFYLRRMYGSPLPVLIGIQQEQMKQRLSWAARSLAESSREFHVIECEYVLGGESGFVPFGNAGIRGRVDRIEYSPSKNILRLIDYKTTDSGDSPQKVHYKPKSGEFLDLQLPLYRMLILRDPAFRLRHPEIDFPNLKILCGYLNMPKSVTETGFVFWEDMEHVMPDAETLVETILDRIGEMKRGIFYEDPDRKILYDPYEFCLLPDLRSAVLNAEWADSETEREVSHE